MKYFTCHMQPHDRSQKQYGGLKMPSTRVRVWFHFSELKTENEWVLLEMRVGLTFNADRSMSGMGWKGVFWGRGWSGRNILYLELGGGSMGMNTHKRVKFYAQALCTWAMSVIPNLRTKGKYLNVHILLLRRQQPLPLTIVTSIDVQVDPWKS